MNEEISLTLLNKNVKYRGFTAIVGAEKSSKNNGQVGRVSYFNTIQPTADLVKPYSNRSRSVKPKRKKTLSERLSVRFETKQKLSALYAEFGNHKKSERISRCGRFTEFKACENGHVFDRKVNYRCENRLCPDCASKASYKKVLEFEPIIEAFLASRPELTPLHLILTQAQKPNEDLKKALTRLRKSVKKLIERDFWLDNFAGSLNSYEFTISYRIYENGAIHYHLHLFAFCKIPDNQRNKKWLADFREVWAGVSNGENKNLKIVPVTDIKKGVRELLKYVCAPQNIEQFTVEHLAQIEELHRCKMTSTFGDFHKFVTDYRAKEKQTVEEPVEERTELCEGDACPTCQKPLKSYRKPIETIIIELREDEKRMELKI
jgi:plasmid rolling circle replication initiator protein Rep